MLPAPGWQRRILRSIGMVTNTKLGHHATDNLSDRNSWQRTKKCHDESNQLDYCLIVLGYRKLIEVQSSYPPAEFYPDHGTANKIAHFH
jgi:hypothetical protein